MKIEEYNELKSDHRSSLRLQYFRYLEEQHEKALPEKTFKEWLESEVLP